MNLFSKIMILVLIAGLLSSCSNASSAQEKTVENLEETKPAQSNANPTKNITPKKSSSSQKLDQKDFFRKQREMIPNFKETFPYNIELKDKDGMVVSSDKLFETGKPTILLFWLTTCPPCQIELKEIMKKYESWEKKANFNLYAISTDFPKNYERFATQVKNSNWPWKAYNDHKRQFRLVMPGGLNGLPQSFVLNKKGEIVLHKRKYRRGDEDKLFESILSLQ